MKPTQLEIDEVLKQCSDFEASGESNYPGMTYEQGVAYAILWMLGMCSNPIVD